MSKRKFKSESEKLLDLMINSIYTHKEIFLRELISNASDAIDKLYFLSLKDESIVFEKDKFYIELTADKEKRTLTIKDTGIGMSEDELNDNLGVIAKSGTDEFKKANETEDIIGHFGVGFYSAFMIAKKVTVETKKFGEENGYLWESEGVSGYEILPSDKKEPGTSITLYLKDDSEEENYSEFLEEYRLRGIIKKYSDYIKYPIKMQVEKTRLKEGSDKDYEVYTEEAVLNSMVPLWRKNKSEIGEEEYNSFYKDKFRDFENPLKTIHTSTDGIVSYNALMYIPAHIPFDYYTKEYEKGLQLYSNGVLIMDKCADLLPDCYGFVKGLVDSQDLTLNISREVLQHDRQLKIIAAHLKKKIKSELLSLLKNKREDYEKFYEAFKRQIKFGVYDNFGAEKEELSDLLMFYSSSRKKLITLDEYIEMMSEDQTHIYYACADTTDKADKLPHSEAIKEKGFEILYLTEDIDEFVIKVLMSYKDKQFMSVSESGEDVKSEETEENKELFAFLKDALGEKVSSVVKSDKLKTHPVCITTRGGISLEMEKVLANMPGDQNVKAERVLEINTEHEVFNKLTSLYEKDKDKLKKYASVLYNGALLIEGMPIEDPVQFSNDICELI